MVPAKFCGGTRDTRGGGFDGLAEGRSTVSEGGGAGGRC